MSGREDRLFDLLPAIYRQRDAEQGSPLQALLRVIAEQVNVVEDDIARLYDNWFIETCDAEVVPYIADLVGYRPVGEAGSAGPVPRREVANTLRYRRRKGTRSLLEDLAQGVAGWPGRAVEFYRLLAFNQHLGHLHDRHRHHRGRTVDLRHAEALDRLDGPFDELAHNVDVRRVASHRTPGRPNLPGVGLYVWRRRSYSVTRTPAYCMEEVASCSSCYTFSVLGNDTPLYVRPIGSGAPAVPIGSHGHRSAAPDLDLPVPIRRRAFDLHRDDYYGEGKSLAIWIGEVAPGSNEVSQRLLPGPGEEIVAADLSDWKYEAQPGQILVDPELGRIVFPSGSLPAFGVWVSYHYGFSADLGGGEYDRPLEQAAGARVYLVGPVGKGAFPTLGDALQKWSSDLQSADPPRDAVVEILDSEVFVEQIHIPEQKLTGKPHGGQIYIELPANHGLELRAAHRRRPVCRLVDWKTAQTDSLIVKGGAGSRFTMDGLLVTGRSVKLEGDFSEVTLRHSTLVPGWSLKGDCKPRWPAEPSLELVHLTGRVTIEHCILGSIEVIQNEVTTDPLPLRLSDSILDATGLERPALYSRGHAVAHVRLTALRSTVFGRLEVHALELGEDSLFAGHLLVARRQIGCLRFSSYVPGSHTPKRYECQPDLAVQAAVGETEKRRELERVRPLFRTMRYGSPDYARLADGCAPEIRRGADDESEMGAFHDLFLPQRAANLAARLNEYTPAGADAGLIFAD